MDKQQFFTAYQDALSGQVGEKILERVICYEFSITQEIALQGAFVLPCDTYCMVSIIVQEDVSVRFVDALVTGDCMRLLSVTVLAGAQVTYDVQVEKYPYARYERLTVTVHEQATFKHYEKHVQGHLTDKEYTYVLAGQGAHVEYQGRVHAQGTERHTVRCVQLHTTPHTTSTVHLKAVAQDAAHCVYEGAIAITKQAVHAAAHQTHKALLLDKRAQVRSVPTLEVATNKVQCGHGSAIAPLDESYFFYGAMRGIPRPRLQHLLVQGFLEF